MNHKRRRPKHRRAGCLSCKPHKDERVAKVARSKRARAILAETITVGSCRIQGGRTSEA